MGTKQIETATVIGTITSAGGNASVVITSAYMTGSPVTVLVPVVLNDTAALVAGKIRPALALTDAITEIFAVSGAGADVVLTNHVALANDTTLNISIDNGTCTGLTATPTSTSTLAGSGITNGYCTLDNVKDYLNSKGLATNTVDDAMIEILIGAASRYIEGQTNDVWYSASSVHSFNTPKKQNELLLFDQPAMSVTTVTNGDGSVIPSTAYILWPANSTPKWGIQLLDNCGYGWTMTNGSPQQAIEITAVWGNTIVPDDIALACMQITVAAYKRRSGENTTGKSIITSGGMVVMPEDVPGIAADIINNHRRNAIG